MVRKYLILVGLGLFSTLAMNAQGSHVLQLGIAALPGGGAQIGYVTPRAFYVTETLAQIDVTPPYAGGEGSAQVSVGLGAAVRPLAIKRVFENQPESWYEFDVGVRFGPSLFFAFNESQENKNRRFSLYAELFGRFTSELGSGQTFFIEGGFQRPLLRAGFWFDL